MKRIDTCLCTIVVLLISSCLSLAQVATGTPQFGSFGGGPFDVVNLGNLNVHFAVPILHKAGRGVDFAYDLSYDSSVWYPVVSSGNTSWQPVLNWGWRAPTEMTSGYVTFTQGSSSPACFFSGNPFGVQYTQSNWTYHDPSGATHFFGGTTIHYAGAPAYCPPDTTLIGTTGDGSGWKLWAVGTTVHNMTAISGKVINPPVNSPGGSAVVTDANGNQITVTGSGNFFDTLSNATAVLTVTGTGTPASPLTFGYIPPASATRVNVQVKYLQYTVKTNFGATDSQGHAIGEYGRTSIALVDNITLPDLSKYSFTYEQTPSIPASGACTPLSGTYANYCVTARIASVTLPTGGQVTYSYSGGSNGIVNDGSAAGLTRTLNPGGTWSYTRSQGAGAQWTTTISDPSSPNNQTLIDFQKDSAAVTTNNFYETQRRSYQGSAPGTLLKTAIVCYNGNSVSTPPSCPTTAVASPIARTSAFTYPDSSGLQAETNTLYDNFGLVTEVDEYDFGSGAVGSLLRKTLISYATMGNNIVDRLSSIVIKDGGNVVKASTSYGYDESAVTASGVTQQHISITGARGNLTTVNAQANGTTHLYRKFTYYDTGSPKTSTGASTSSTTNGPTTTYSYAPGAASCNGAFVTSISEPLSLSRSMTWNCSGAVQTSVTDENGKITSTQYSDASFWRPASVSYPDGGQTSFTYNTVTAPWNIQVSSKIDSTRSVTTKAVLDGLGRSVQNQLTSDPTGTVYTDTTFNPVGNVSSVSNPYRTTGDPTYGLTSYAYDALNRITSITNPGGSTILQNYTGRAVRIQDEGNGAARVAKIYQSDGIARLTSTCEVTGATLLGITPTPGPCAQDIAATGFLTSYQYDTLGNLTGATQGGLNPRTYAYDQLSRMTSETNPESGQTTYTYDSCSAGDLCQRVAPKPNQTNPSVTVTTSYAYDALHRLTGKTYDDGVTNSANFVYDLSSFWGITVSNPKGHMIAETSGAGLFGNVYSYDSMGRRQNTSQAPPIIAGSGSYPVNYTYDLLGNLVTLYNGFEGVTYTYSYDTAARLSKLQSNFVDANHPGTLLTANQYNPLGELQQATLGNGIVRNLQFDNRGRVTSLTDGSIYSFALGFAPDSNILTGNDLVNGNWTYTYDDVSRLSTSSKSGQAFNYKYDRFGNRWQQNATVGGGPQPQYMFDANNHIVGNSYDAAGNMMFDAIANYQYDPEHRLISVSPLSGAAASYVYDASGRRVQSTVGGSAVDYIYDQAGRAITQLYSGGWTWSELYAGGLHVATYSGGTTTFDHSDWLGTVRAHSNVSGASAETCASLPFGDGQTCTSPDWSLLHFTGQLRDSESNLDHFWFRQYSSTQGRWMMPDPAGVAAVDPSDPQSWNRYAYVSNNPLNAIDPVGLCTVGQSITSGWTITITVNSWPCPTLQPWLTVTNFGCFLTGLCNVPSQSGGGNSGGGGAGAGQGGPANNVRSRLDQIANHLRQCGGVYPLVAATAGTFNIGSVPSQYAVTSPSDNASNGFNGGNSTTTIDASNFANADPVTQTGVVVHEWFHQMQINNSYVFRFKVFFNRQGVEAEANAAAKEAIQKCGPG